MNGLLISFKISRVIHYIASNGTYKFIWYFTRIMHIIEFILIHMTVSN